MDYIDERGAIKPIKPIKPKQPKPTKKQTAKCSWCDRKRARNDLCNVCRQKVESRARRLMEQKLEGDMEVIKKVMKYLHQNIPVNELENTEIMSLILECFPFLMLKFQSENTYRGKKGNRCWCLPESVLKKLITKFYTTDKKSSAIVDKGGRQELCQLLMNTVSKHFNNYGINNNTNGNITSMKMENNSVKNLKRNSMDGLDDNNKPPRKRSKIDNMMNANNNNNRMEDGEVRIWGRSDTELLSFDITKLASFLHKFENKVLNGVELERVDANQRVEFLKKRCKEFVKILTELRDYVLHLRAKVINGNDDDNGIILNAKNREIVELKKRIDGLSNEGGYGKERLMRCTTDLLSKLSPTPVDTNLLRLNMDKLEQYHNLACKELSEAVYCIESIGNKIGYDRLGNMTLKQYTSHLEQNIVTNNTYSSTQLQGLYIDNNTPNMTTTHTNNNNNNNNFNISLNNNQQQHQHQHQQQQQHNTRILNPFSYNNTPMNMTNNNNNRQMNNQIQAIQQQIQQFNAQNSISNTTTSQRRIGNIHNTMANNNSNIINIGMNNNNNQQQQQPQQHILLAPTTYPLQITATNISNNNNIGGGNRNHMISPSIPINATTLQSLDFSESAHDNKCGPPYFDFGIETESDTTDSLLHQYNVI